MSYAHGGSEIGTLAGGGLGLAFGGPIGASLGAGVGNYLGGKIGGLFGSQGPSAEEQAAAAYRQQIIAQQQAAYAQQQQLAQQLRIQAAGGGPSVAGAQLGQGLEQINRGQASQAAGVGGEGGVLARYAAMNAAANTSADANQSAALARVQEQTNAQRDLAGVLNNEGATAANIYGTQVGGANTANANNINATKNDRDFGLKLLGSGLRAYSDYKAGLSSGGAPKVG